MGNNLFEDNVKPFNGLFGTQGEIIPKKMLRKSFKAHKTVFSVLELKEFFVKLENDFTCPKMREISLFIYEGNDAPLLVAKINKKYFALCGYFHDYVNKTGNWKLNKLR